MLSPEAELNAAVEQIAEPSRAEDSDHLSFRKARELMATVIQATRTLAQREHSSPRDHSPGDCKRATTALDYALLDLLRGTGRALPGNKL